MHDATDEFVNTLSDDERATWLRQNGLKADDLEYAVATGQLDEYTRDHAHHIAAACLNNGITDTEEVAACLRTQD